MKNIKIIWFKEWQGISLYRRDGGFWYLYLGFLGIRHWDFIKD
jgi:hypothetical protein